MKKIKDLYSFIKTKQNIVWSFKGILLSFVYLFQKYPKNVDFLFFCHDVYRHSQKDEKFYAPLVDPIIEELDDKNIVSLASPFSKIHGKMTYGNVRIDNFSILIAFTKRLIFKGSLELTDIDNDPLIKSYKRLLKRIKPKKVIGIQPSIELCIAAKELNIKTYDIQHGIITDINYYNVNKRIDINQEGWPDVILCWDENSTRRLEKISGGLASNIVIGNPAYHSDYGMNMRKKSSKNKRNIVPKNKIILVSLTYLDYGVFHHDECYREIGIPKKLVELINEMPSFNWYLRLHPIQMKFNFTRVSKFLEKHFSHLDNVDWHTPSTNSLNSVLNDCHGHITVESATALDAAQNSIPTIFVSCPGITDKEKIEINFLEYLEAGIMKYVDLKYLDHKSLDFFSNYSSFTNDPLKGSINEGYVNFKKFISILKNNEI
tara:strand:- start:3665 stop:4960 length:1296 start_codon:yes stop_codon:yes gene_type:complete